VASRWSLRALALGYLGALLLAPVALVVRRTFAHGAGHVIDSVTTPAAIHAFQLTLELALIAVPLNAAFGIVAALVLVRGRFRGKALLDALIDLPFAVSPVVIGLALVLVYGRGGWLSGLPFQVLFSLPGMALATIFVSLPFVVREVAPVLLEVGDEQEQAAATLGATRWQAFRRITLPSIRWGVAYGVVLSVARAIGEFGAVSVVSGNIAGRTETLTLLVQRRFENFDLAGAYAASTLLALIALATLLTMTLMRTAFKMPAGRLAPSRGAGSPPAVLADASASTAPACGDRHPRSGAIRLAVHFQRGSRRQAQ
jgi:sulfate/thiosulfate transport system permease protein